MSSKLMSVLLVTVALASFGATVRADGISTSGVTCHNYNAWEALDIDYFANGVRNFNTDPRMVTCAVPRSPFAGPSTFFEIDGHNDVGTATSCTVNTYNTTGGFTGSMSFTKDIGLFDPAASNWSQFVAFTSAQLASVAYVTLTCTLPGSGQGLIWGISAF